MNRKLFAKVKDLCKDTGLSEKYLTAITEKLGGSVEDDSTEEAVIDETANLIADIAKESQGEATRWVSKKKEESTEDEEGKKSKKSKDTKTSEDVDESKRNPDEERIKALEEKIEEMCAERNKGLRDAEIAMAMERHKIPAKFRDRLSKSISEDEDIETVVAALKQDFITGGLMADDAEGGKGASEKQIDEAADSLLESITAK